jgi:hypothetical protein
MCPRCKTVDTPRLARRARLSTLRLAADGSSPLPSRSSWLNSGPAWRFGGCAAALAMRHEINANQLRRWVKLDHLVPPARAPAVLPGVLDRSRLAPSTGCTTAPSRRSSGSCRKHCAHDRPACGHPRMVCGGPHRHEEGLPRTRGHRAETGRLLVVPRAQSTVRNQPGRAGTAIDGLRLPHRAFPIPSTQLMECERCRQEQSDIFVMERIAGAERKDASPNAPGRSAHA